MLCTLRGPTFDNRHIWSSPLSAGMSITRNKLSMGIRLRDLHYPLALLGPFLLLCLTSRRFFNLKIFLHCLDFTHRNFPFLLFFSLLNFYWCTCKYFGSLCFLSASVGSIHHHFGWWPDFYWSYMGCCNFCSLIWLLPTSLVSGFKKLSECGVISSRSAISFGVFSHLKEMVI